MSAPDHARPLGNSGWIYNGHEMNEKEAIESLPDIYCEGCGWHGNFVELLGVDPDEDETLWCPQCGSSGWVFN